MYSNEDGGLAGVKVRISGKALIDYVQRPCYLWYIRRLEEKQEGLGEVWRESNLYLD